MMKTLDAHMHSMALGTREDRRPVRSVDCSKVLAVLSVLLILIVASVVTSTAAYAWGGGGFGSNTTTLGNGSDPAGTTLAPSGAATMADAFTFVTDGNSDSVSNVTVTLATGTYVGISKIEITNSAGTTVYGSVTNPATNTPTITLSTNTLTATTTTTTYKIRITPKTHANVAAPPGASYAVTARISGFSPSSNSTAGSDSAGTTVTIDNLSPGNVTGATATAGSSQVNLSWTNPVDGDLSSVIVLRRTGGAVADTPTEGSSYSVGNTIGSSTVACVASAPSTSCADTGLVNGTAYYYKMFALDSRGNYSATGVVPTGSPATPTLDVTAPAAVVLSTGTVTSGSVQLTWSAPGDDNNTGTPATYDVRYSTSAIDAPNWASATQATGEPTPSVAGSGESFTVTGLSATTTYYFAIKTGDEIPNWSNVSNSPSATTLSADVTSPADIIGLTVTSSTTTTLTVGWTSPGDDGNSGTATSYDIRYSTSPITSGNWASATQASGEPAPSVAGTSQSFTITGLSVGTTYYIAMKTSDEVPNTSGLSNIAVGTTGNTGTTLVLHPSGAATGDGAGYTGGTAATAMDSNDGDSSYGSSASSTNDFYVNLDNTSATGTITAVQISALASNAGGWSSTGFNVGLKTNGSTYLGGAQSSSSSSYSTYAGTSYATNPNTGIAWAWTDINNLIAAVDHTDANTLRVTEFYATVSYIPGDVTAPAAITLSTGTLTDTSVVLNWTAPGDDSNTGTATVYDIRYSTSAIDASNWASATHVSGEPAPSAAGASETYTVTGLSPNTTYYFAIKTADEVPNWSTISNSTSATTLERPVGGYTADNVIPSAQISQATDGSGLITITWKARDGQSQNVTLKTFQYSTDGGSTWNAPTNGDASASLSTNWNNNGGGGWTTATTFAAAAAHSFTFNTKHADVSGINGTDQSDIRVRFTLNDGGIDSSSPAISDSVRVDDLSPTSTITGAVYDAATYTMTITGANFTAIAAASTDIKSYVNWSKFVWDINGDGATTANVGFAMSDVSSLTISDDTTLTLVLTASKGAAITATSGYGPSGGFDTLAVTAGFVKDYYGNAATTDGANAELVTMTISGTVYYNDETANIGSGYTVRLLVNGASKGTAVTDASGNYTIWTNVTGGYAILAYIDNDATYQGTTVTITSSVSLSGFDIYADHLTVRHDNGGSLTNAHMSTAKGAYSDSDILYSVSGGALTVSGSITELHISTGHSYAPGGNVTTPAMDNVGTFSGGSGSITVNGYLTNSGSFTATSGTTTVSGNFINSGTFAAGGGTVVLNGTNQILSGDTTFNNFTKSVSSADTLKFAANSTTTITGTATLNGASGQLLSLRSTSTGTRWNIHFTGSKSISFVDVKDSDTSGSAVANKPVQPTHSVDSGNNAEWFPYPIITITKISAVISDPINNITNPKRIPGAIIEFTIAPANSGTASPDADSVYVTDAVDSTTMTFDVNGGVSFSDGATTSGLVLGTVSYSNTAAPGPYVYNYTPVPDGNGYDGNVTAVKITTTGSFAYGGSPNASFNLKFRVKVK